jgi:hypothetical protein
MFADVIVDDREDRPFMLVEVKVTGNQRTLQGPKRFQRQA